MLHYLDYERIANIHNDILERTGGLAGVLDDNLLHSCVEIICDDMYYPDLESKTTHLVFSLVKNHCFKDGNKRTALAVSTYFLAFNNIPKIYLDEYNRIMERIILLVANSIIDKGELLEIVTDLINFGGLSFETKMYFNRPLPEENYI